MKYSIIFQNNDFYIVEKYPQVESYETANELNAKKNIERNGLIHRLDKDTSGLMIVSKSTTALNDIQKLFKERKVSKSYLGLVWGEIEKIGEVELNITRDPKRKKPMKIVSYSSQSKRGLIRVSKTSWKVLKYLKIKNNILSLVEFQIQTGRTHQIRLTAHYLRHPIIGDGVYCFKDSRRFSESINLDRQFLHSHMISFRYKNETFKFTSELPMDLKKILDKTSPAIEK